jgi:hypothetical protein
MRAGLNQVWNLVAGKILAGSVTTTGSAFAAAFASYTATAQIECPPVAALTACPAPEIANSTPASTSWPCQIRHNTPDTPLPRQPCHQNEPQESSAMPETAPIDAGYRHPRAHRHRAGPLTPEAPI